MIARAGVVLAVVSSPLLRLSARPLGLGDDPAGPDIRICGGDTKLTAVRLALAAPGRYKGVVCIRVENDLAICNILQHERGWL